MTKKGLIKRADRYSFYLAALLDRKCIQCGTRENPTVGHFFGARRYSGRWHPDNFYLQCAGCNIKHEENSEPMRRAVLKFLTEKELEQLEAIWARPVPQVDFEYVVGLMFELLTYVVHKSPGLGMRPRRDQILKKAQSAGYTNKEWLQLCSGDGMRRSEFRALIGELVTNYTI